LDKRELIPTLETKGTVPFIRKIQTRGTVPFVLYKTICKTSRRYN